MEPDENSLSNQEDYYAYDVRTDMVFKFKRMNKYILLQTIPMGTFMKISLEEFDAYFEGTPPPMAPFLMRTR